MKTVFLFSNVFTRNQPCNTTKCCFLAPSTVLSAIVLSNVTRRLCYFTAGARKYKSISWLLLCILPWFWWDFVMSSSLGRTVKFTGMVNQCKQDIHIKQARQPCNKSLLLHAYDWSTRRSQPSRLGKVIKPLILIAQELLWPCCAAGCILQSRRVLRGAAAPFRNDLNHSFLVTPRKVSSSK